MKQKRAFLLVSFLGLFILQQIRASAHVLPGNDLTRVNSPQGSSLPSEIHINMLHLDLNDGGNVASPRQHCAYLERADGCGEANTQYPYSSPIALVDVEDDYLLDVLPREMNVAENDPGNDRRILSAYAAQALAARSVMAWKSIHLPDPYETNGYINNSISYQVFIPYAYEYYHPSSNTLISEAVNSTRGQYLSHSGEAIDAEFGSDMQDRTQTEHPPTPTPGFVPKPYLIGVEEPISTTCDSASNSNGFGMSQLGAYRWSRGNQCAVPSQGEMP